MALLRQQIQLPTAQVELQPHIGITVTMSGEGTTIIVSSHVMDEAERCGRLGLMRFGRMLADGTSAELRRLAGVERLEDAFLVLSESTS